ncbi:MAG: 16S rRNA (cytosine(967)-C(5))-methyltransferase RsmB [Actinomycetota bacterium]
MAGSGRVGKGKGRKEAHGGLKKVADPPVDARDMAYLLTRRVHAQGGYLGLLLRYGLNDEKFSARDRALVAELAYGVQRHRNKLDHVISTFSNRPLKELNPEVLDILRLGVFQIMEMNVPPHAAVNESVELAKRHLGKGAGYVNAVMRGVAEGLTRVSWPGPEDMPAHLEVVHSHPRWLVEYMIKRFGEKEALELCHSDNQVPTLTLRVNPLRTSREDLLREIESHGWRAKPSSFLPEALIEVVMPYTALLEWLEEGICVAQDESSMLVSHVVGPQQGKVVVDACAAPGGKATHLAQMGGRGCRVIAVDRNPRRLRAMRTAVQRLGLENITILEGDAARLREVVGHAADAVLLDAPCSGLGTLRRKPELKWRRFPGDIANLAAVQSRLIRGCADVVRPGGVLVYSVCTFTLEETVGVVEGFLRERKDYVPESPAMRVPEALAAELSPRGYLQLLPHRHGMEGMFIARLRRKE